MPTTGLCIYIVHTLFTLSQAGHLHMYAYVNKMGENCREKLQINIPQSSGNNMANDEKKITERNIFNLNK